LIRWQKLFDRSVELGENPSFLECFSKHPSGALELQGGKDLDVRGNP